MNLIQTKIVNRAEKMNLYGTFLATKNKIDLTHLGDMYVILLGYNKWCLLFQTIKRLTVIANKLSV